MSTPLMIVGDGPQEPTGLGRIARDLCSLINAAPELAVDLVQVGGAVPPVWSGWRHYPLDRQEDWGAACVQATWQSIFGNQPGMLWIIWDPGRLYPYTQVDLPVQRWAYTAVDAANICESIGGPGRQALDQFDRVIAYGRWASRIIRTIRPTVSYLPHGLTTACYSAPADVDELAWVDQQLGPYCNRHTMTLVGCVATNQARKDLGLYCHTLAKLRERGMNVYGWLHTDVLVKDWAIPQLIEDFGLSRRITITLPELTDRQLALLYQACAITVAPGLGEGFGYPIVESLASGTPVVHGDYAGGAELLPKTEWRFPVRMMRLESVYAVKRPVFDVEDVANAIERALAWKKTVGSEITRAYCQGTVAYLDWSVLWPRWRSWIQRGLEGR